ISFGPAQPLDWMRDYKSGKGAPHIFYGEIDYSDAPQIGDIKYIWELNRCQFLAPWALEHEMHSGGDSGGARAVCCAIQSWIRDNPRHLGVNWASSLELALRILAWGIALDLCADAPCVADARPHIARSVREQAEHIRHTLSLFSSANNHLVGELTGLLAAH